MEYILGPKNGPCIFCEFPKRARFREDLVLAVRGRAFVCLNKYPFAAGHILVVPNSHVADLDALSPEEHSAFFDLVRDASKALREAVRCDGMNIGINLGQAGGAGIADHLHAHAVPRWAGDSNFMPVIADTRVMPEYLDATWHRLRPFFQPLETS
jgi:ATP adenylyltransferase